MVRKKLLRAVLALTLCVSLIMPVAEVNMQEVMAAEYRYPSVTDAPKEWNGVDDVVIHIDKGAGWSELNSIGEFSFDYGHYGLFDYTLSEDAYTYDADNGTITINGKKLFNEVGKYCGKKDEYISWKINRNEETQLSGSMKYTGEPNEHRYPSVIDAPEEWNGVDDVVIHVDKGAGIYELDSIGEFRFGYGYYGFLDYTLSRDAYTYDADNGTITINGKKLFNEVGKRCSEKGEKISWGINRNEKTRLSGSMKYTGEPNEQRKPSVIDAPEEWNGVDDVVIHVDKGAGKSELYIEGKFYFSKGDHEGYVVLSEDAYTYDADNGTITINGKKLFNKVGKCCEGKGEKISWRIGGSVLSEPAIQGDIKYTGEPNEQRYPSVIDAPEEWNSVDDVVIRIDKGAGKYELDSIKYFRFSKGDCDEYVDLSEDAYAYDADNGTITINGKKLFNKVGRYCGEKDEKIRWEIRDSYYISGYIKYTGEPNEYMKKPSVTDAPEEWNGVDDFVIHIDKGAGKYELGTIEPIEFSWSNLNASDYDSYQIGVEEFTYNADKGEIRIDGKTLFDKIGKYVVTGNGIRYRIGGWKGIYGSFTYTGSACDLHYPAVFGDENERGEKSIEWNGVDDLVIPIDKGTGEYEMVSCHFVGDGIYGGIDRLLSFGSDIYDSSKGGVVINAAALYSLYRMDYQDYDAACHLGMKFTLANGEEFLGYGLNITATAKPEADENGLVIMNGSLVDYFGWESEIIIPETVTAIMRGALSGLKEAKITINGNNTSGNSSGGTDIYDNAFVRKYSDKSSLQELILNGYIGYMGYTGPNNIDTVTVNGIVSGMFPEINCSNLIVNGDIAYIYDGERNYLKNTKIYCKENSNILRYAKENELNYEIIEKQPNEPQIQSANNEFDGTKDLIFKLDNTSDIKEIKSVLLLLSDNVNNGDFTTYSCHWNGLTNSIEYNPETGEVTLFKEGVSSMHYGNVRNNIGNTFLGHIVYIAQDGTEKHAFGDWHVKILDKSPDATAQYMYRLPDGKTDVSSSDIQDLISQNETQDVCITANDIAYTFAKGTMKVEEGRDSYDFGAEVITDYGMLSSPPFTEEEFAFRINYNHAGDLPAVADITIPAGIQWAGKTLYYYEVTESGFYKFIAGSVVDEAGNFTISQSHCSDYVALTKSPDEMEVNIAEEDVSVSPTNLTYNGKAQEPSVVVESNGKTLTYGTDYTLTYRNNTNAGTAEVIVEGKGNYSGSVTKTFVIGKADIAEEDVSVSPTNMTYSGKAQEPSVVVKSDNETLTYGTDYTLTYRNNTNAGTAEITVEGKGNYAGSVTKTFVIEKANQGISGTKTYKKTYGDKKFSLDAKSTGDGKLTYSSSDKKVAIVDKNGKVTIKGTGIAVITVKADAAANYNANTAGMKVTLNVSPAKQTIKSIKAVKGKKLTVKWKKDTKATGYQIQYGTDKKFKKGVKTVDIKKNKTTSNTIAKLKKGQKYYVRVRSYKTVKANGKTTKLYGKWSSVKLSANIKK